MRINPIAILQELTKVCSSFCVIRGKDTILEGTYRDIDCFVRVDEFFVVDNKLTALGFERINLRRGALFYSLQSDEINCIFDLHIDFSIHGVDWNINYDPDKHCDISMQIRFLDETSTNEHAILISIYQNKGKNCENLYLPPLEELSFINPSKYLYYKAQYFLRFKYSHIKIFFYIFLLFSSLNITLQWLSFYREKALSISAINNFGRFKVRERLLMLKTASIKEICVKNTRDQDLRFGWLPAEKNIIADFISTHSKRSKIIYFILKYFWFLVAPDNKLRIYNSNGAGSGRNIVGIFFGTPSKDRSLLFYYKKRNRAFFIKFSSEEEESNYNARYEYEAILFFQKVQNVFNSPRARFYKNALVTSKISRNTSKFQPHIDEYLTCLTLAQFSYCKFGTAQSLLIEYPLAHTVKNTVAFEYYQALRLELEENIDNFHEVIATSWAHGDLTPWNVLETSPKLTLIDFEKFRFSDCVVGYDFAHYYISSFIFSTENKTAITFSHIRSKMADLWDELNFKGKPGLGLLTCLVLLEYLQVAVSSDAKLTEYRALYRVVDLFLQNKNEI